jgi:hypothetical protein
MSLQQLTKCAPPGGEGNAYLRSILAGLGFGSAWAFIAWALGASLTGIIAGGLFAAAYAGIVAFCDYFFNARLICVADSDVLVGTFWEQEEAWDGDFCLNVLPAPFKGDEPGGTLSEMQDPAAVQRRFLVLPGALSGYDFKPDHVHVNNTNSTPLVHNEIEGTKLQVWCSAMVAALATLVAVTTAAGAGCAVFGPFWWLCALVVIAIGALIAYLVNEIAHAVGDQGSVADVAVDPDAATIRAEDHPAVAIEGRLIYDAGHEGWLELHAVRKIMTVSDDDRDNFDATRWREIAEKIREASYVGDTGQWTGALTAAHDRLG